jgi:hypothetical protein
VGDWAWVAAGYAMTGLSLLGYVIALRMRERAVRRARDAAARRGRR